MKTRLDGIKSKMEEKLGGQRGREVSAAVDREYALLCREEAENPKELIRHLHNNIFPVIASFRALMKEGLERGEASELVCSSFLELMEEPAGAIRRLCRLPGFYRLVPGLFGKLMPKLFKKEAGFDFAYYPTDKNRVRFDMLSCPYLKVCQELGCSELAHVFCDTDDICYGHMHPRLIWKRTETLARGGERCNFDIEIENPES